MIIHVKVDLIQMCLKNCRTIWQTVSQAVAQPRSTAYNEAISMRVKMMTPDELIQDFAVLETWDDRYGYLIDLGRALPPMSAADRCEETRIDGCMSGVWVKASPTEETPPRLHFVGDSDAAIVKGLVAIVLSLCNGRTPHEILAFDIRSFFIQLHLENHLSPTRKNGLNALVNTIRQYAADLA